MANILYNRCKANLMNKEIDLEADAIKIMLTTSSYTPAVTHNVKTDVTNEVTGTGYTAGGATLASKAVTQAATTKWDAADVTWSTSTITARYAVIYDDTHATDDLILCLDFGSDKSSSGADFTIQFDAAGILTLA